LGYRQQRTHYQQLFGPVTKGCSLAKGYR